MFDFFGTFLDGPLAGSTFGGVINDGSGGDSVGPFLALGGMAFVLAIVLSIIIAPFVAWPSLIASDLNEGRGIWGAIILIAIQFIFIILRIRSNVRHWKRSFLSDLLLNMLFLFLLFFLSVVILFVPLIALLGGSEMGAYAAAHHGEFLGTVFSNLFSNLFGIVFFIWALSMIPAALTTGCSTLFIRKAARAAGIKA
ncbi:MAG: hypothetical protein U0M47_09290 [Merdibacter sp.]|nr:hypothetical protein [Merdibacter sp.]